MAIFNYDECSEIRKLGGDLYLVEVLTSENEPAICEADGGEWVHRMWVPPHLLSLALNQADTKLLDMALLDLHAQQLKVEQMARLNGIKEGRDRAAKDLQGILGIDKIANSLETIAQYIGEANA